MANHFDLEEQEQIEQLKHFWNTWGTLITGVLVVIFVGFAGWNGYQYWEKRQATQAAALAHAGIVLRREIQECWYRHDELLHGELNLLVLDPDGYLLRFTEDLGFKPAVSA